MARRPHGRALACPGGWSLGNIDRAACVFCGAMVTMGNGWRNVVLDVAVCPTCMPDPWKKLPRSVRVEGDPDPPRYVGERVTAQVRALIGKPA